MEAETRVRVEETGVLHFMRAEDDGKNECLCCDGPHVFALGIDLDEPDWVGHRRGMSDLGREFARQFKNDLTMDGARVRITISLDPAPEKP